MFQRFSEDHAFRNFILIRQKTGGSSYSGSIFLGTSRYILQLDPPNLTFLRGVKRFFAGDLFMQKRDSFIQIGEVKVFNIKHWLCTVGFRNKFNKHITYLAQSSCHAGRSLSHGASDMLDDLRGARFGKSVLREIGPLTNRTYTSSLWAGHDRFGAQKPTKNQIIMVKFTYGVRSMKCHIKLDKEERVLYT